MIRMPFHLVEPSPWPMTSALGALLITMGITSWFHNYNLICLKLGIPILIISMYVWWRDVVRESTFMGHHTSLVVKGLRYGMILFITSEVCFFFGFFWTFFHSSLCPVPEIGCMWPPTGIQAINPFGVPLLNTIVLLSSGVTVTWAHHSLKANNRPELLISLSYTITLGTYFTTLQLGEYMNSPFTIADSIFGSVFFVATGFHGFHVLIGTTFLFICLIRAYKWHFASNHHFGFEAAAWYWHFVDVVWIFLFLCIYWWGS
uniref:cytochrome c oxidase subunit III n=1 Tax=Dinobdella ferox TaxID=755736 RepID=UPI0023D7EC72|nr:cytochrome c oxidase subunit III [Dinobdella ferox]WDA96088.1 cytochrome c oxidase subunit III [Dinobdella ferox]